MIIWYPANASWPAKHALPSCTLQVSKQNFWHRCFMPAAPIALIGLPFMLAFTQDGDLALCSLFLALCSLPLALCSLPLALCSLPLAPALDLSLLVLPQPTSNSSALPLHDLSSNAARVHWWSLSACCTVCWQWAMGNTQAHLHLTWCCRKG